MKRIILLIFLLLLINSCSNQTKEPIIVFKENVIDNEKNKVAEEPVELEKDNAEKEIVEEKETKEEKVEEIPEKKLLMFHNNKGQMCLEQLDFLENIKKDYPELVIEEHLTDNQESMNLLGILTSEYKNSEGFSNNFRYLPITFINNHAYSGFNEEVKDKLKKDIEEICR